MADKEIRLFGPMPAPSGGPAETVYTVPDAGRTILRHLHCYNGTPDVASFTMSIGADAPETRLFDQYQIAANQPYDWWCYLPLDATEIVQVIASASAPGLIIEGSGIERTL